MARFMTIDAASDAPTGCARAIVKTVVALSLPFVLSPRELATEVASNVVDAFTACFSCFGQRHLQFNYEHKEALLQEDERFSEAAMIELRQRIIEGGTFTMPAVRSGPMTTDQPARPLRWKERKIRERKSSLPPDRKISSPEKVFTTLASDTERALDQILESTKTTRKHFKSSEIMDATFEWRQKMGELHARKKANAMSQEKTGVGSVLLDLQDDNENFDGGPLREWLAKIDASRSEEYCVYAKQLKEHGFLTLKDLAVLESEDDMDQAMSEVGIAKFAHRLRIRKAIRQLHRQSYEENAVVAATIPTAA